MADRTGIPRPPELRVREFPEVLDEVTDAFRRAAEPGEYKPKRWVREGTVSYMVAGAGGDK